MEIIATPALKRTRDLPAYHSLSGGGIALVKSTNLQFRHTSILTDDPSFSLAHAEMRLILARVLFNFDLEWDDKSKNWANDLKAFSLWQKTPLLVNLKPVA
jgi:hypothetical protein